MVVVKNRPTEVETPPQPNTFLDAAFYIKLQATLEVIFDFGWGVFIRQFQFDKLNDRMSKLKKCQNVNKSAEETAVKLDGKMPMDAKLIGKFITQQVAVAMDEKKNSMKRKLKNWRKVGRMDYWECREKKGTRGGGSAYKKNKTSATKITTKSKTTKKSMSR